MHGCKITNISENGKEKCVKICTFRKKNLTFVPKNRQVNPKVRVISVISVL